jgi:Zn-dependent M28 family amino/carboxypeptidase
VKNFILLLSLLLLGCKSNKPLPLEQRLQNTVATLAADAMMGRQAGTQGAHKAADYLAAAFAELKLQPLAGETDFMQRFSAGKFDALQNVVAQLPGKRSKEFVVFSAHYDHIGILDAVAGDSIANGADDDASGVAAVLALARHFSQQPQPERTLVFALFDAEEAGMLGSKHLAQQLDPEQVVAVVNLEMLGKPSKFGMGKGFITGYEVGQLPQLLQQAATPGALNPDPYLQLNLFYRSDNAPFARLGIPAHTISSDQIDKDKYYHTVDDEVETLNFRHMAALVQQIQQAVGPLVQGQVTPARIAKK